MGSKFGNVFYDDLIPFSSRVLTNFLNHLITFCNHTEGEDELFERKMTKEEKKAAAKAKRDAKKGSKSSSKKDKTRKDDDVEEKKEDAGDYDNVAATNLARMTINSDVDPNSEEGKREAALENLSKQNIVVTYENRKGNLHANTRDINVGGVSVAFHGKMLIEETDVVINYGNRYGFIGPNGSGKVSLFYLFGVSNAAFVVLTNYSICSYI